MHNDVPYNQTERLTDTAEPKDCAPGAIFAKSPKLQCFTGLTRPGKQGLTQIPQSVGKKKKNTPRAPYIPSDQINKQCKPNKLQALFPCQQRVG